MCSKAIKKITRIVDPIASKVFGGLLGGADKIAPAPPPPPPPPPAPPPPAPPPEIQDVARDAAPVQTSTSRRRRRGRGSTIFTSPLGDTQGGSLLG